MLAVIDLRELQAKDLVGLAPEAAVELAKGLLQVIQQQGRELAAKDSELQFKQAKLEKITFELARLKAWKFGARAEAMNAEQRRLFEETLAEDEASLRAQLEQLKAKKAASDEAGKDSERKKRKPRRQPLPEHLPRVEHHHEPADTSCPMHECAKPMVRVGEDISEELDVIPAKFFVHRHIYGKWACRCCQVLKQEPAAPRVNDGGIASVGLVVHTLISRFVDHLPYYRQESINARSGVYTPRSTLAQCAGRGGAALEPLYDAHRPFVLSARVLHADETPVAMLDPGAGKTKRAYVWAYARGAFDEVPGVIYEFCAGRGSQYPIAFLQGQDGPGGGRSWRGTLVRDEYAAYDSVVDARTCAGRAAAGCLAHARRKFEQLARHGASPVAQEALQRIARIYRAENGFAQMSAGERLAAREAITRPMWQALHLWLQFERARVADGSATARALDYSLNNWETLTRHLVDGEVPVDNNHVENQIRPWAMGRKAWLFAGSELAGQRAAIVMSLVQSAKLNRLDPYAYLKDVLERLPSHPASRIDELLPHRWQPLA